ncbi:FAD-dependent monooxygenase [Streptomyces acidiscabies]|uniref:FAD-dependent monooxygenase n=1 Tax=Streptomyces acidiscabies TaxID=42234 RepID=UPI0038F745D8
MDTSVVVVGAGPTGLMTAGELRLAGVDVVVLERLPARTGESRGIGMTIRTVELFDQRALLPRLARRQGSAIEYGTQGHFGGVALDLSPLGATHQAAKAVPQSVTEKTLESWARELGADIRTGHEVLSVEQDNDSVRVRVRTADGDHTLTARYLVGCDGGHSLVRKAAGFDFPGTPATTELLLADLHGVDIAPRRPGSQVAGGMAMSARLPDGAHRVIVSERDAPPRRRSGPPAFAEVADAWKRLTGEDISAARPVWVSAFGDAARLVTEYRRGRILLAGDAAHIHLPAGGQGMNAGIQDAMNLGWKLAATLRGDSPAGLLDTYHSERHGVGRRLIDNTRAQSLLILGGADAQPLREVLTELAHHEDVTRRLGALVSGLDIRYDVGTGAHPLLGLRMPHLRLRRAGHDTSSTETLRTGRGVLLDLADSPRLRERAARWRDRVDIVTATAVGVPPDSPLTGTTAVLLRPDGHVAWAAPGSHHDLPAASARWFGPPR